MAEQLLPGPEAPAGEGPQGPDFGAAPPLISETVAADKRPGRTFEDRALQQVRGTGPHVTTGGKIDQMIGTAGRVNQLMHGQTGPESTSGEAQRQQLIGARQARQDPYRDSLSYREDFGTTMSPEVHQKAQGHQASFQKHIADTNTQLAQYSQQVAQNKQALAQDRQKVQTEYQSGTSRIESEYSRAMSDLKYKDLNQEYQNWYRTNTDPAWVMSGSSPSNPGNQEATYRLSRSQLGSVFSSLVGAGMKVQNNRIYVGGRGQEVHDVLRNAQNRNKTEFYQKVAPQIQQYNAQVDQAKSNLNSQRSQAFSQLNTQYSQAQTQLSNLSSQIAAEEGAIQGRRQGLQLEIRANQDDLKKVRQDYRDRLSRVDEALSAMAGRTTESRSTGEVKQITPRMVGQQQG